MEGKFLFKVKILGRPQYRYYAIDTRNIADIYTDDDSIETAEYLGTVELQHSEKEKPLGLSAIESNAVDTKEKVKKWRWIITNKKGGCGLEISISYLSEDEQLANYNKIQKIDATMIEE